ETMSKSGLAIALLFALIGMAEMVVLPQSYRRPNDSDLRFWLRNMRLYHHYSNEEITAAVGIPEPEITELLDKYAPGWDWGPAAAEAKNLFILPYPGGRHPRIGFLDGAVDPQRETKFSVFCPWDVN